MAAVELILPGMMPDGFMEQVQAHELPPPLPDDPGAGGVLFSALSLRLMGALLPMVEYFDGLEHRQVGSGDLLRCAVYFTDAPDVYASCTLVEDQHYVLLGVDLVEQLARCCDSLGKVLAHRGEKDPDLEALKAELNLDAVLSDFTPLTDEERASLAERINTWPVPGFGVAHDAPGIAEMTVLHDLLRIVVAHEFAHSTCGHVQFFATQMGAKELPEFAESRSDAAMHEKMGVPRTHILQAIELHADEWSIRFSALQVLAGHDPAGLMFENQVNLIDRLLLLNVAAGIFAIRWTLMEQQSNPGATFWIGDSPLDENEGPDVIRSMGAPFIVVRSSHPPAVLRYYRHQNWVQYLSHVHYGPQHLGTQVAAHTITFMNQIAGGVSGYFYSLVRYTPMIAKTPNMKRLNAYEDYLMTFSELMAPYIQEFLPAGAAPA